MTFRRWLLLAAAAAVFIPLMLVADGPDVSRQLGVGLATGLFLVMLVRLSPVPATQIVTAMVIATTGELFLSLGWGLYSYRWAAVPYFVPPGHGIFYGLAAASSLVPELRQRRRAIVGFSLVSGTAVAFYGLVQYGDTWGLLWWCGAAALMAFHRSALLFALCWIYTMPLEWLGTWIGNWTWMADVPYVHLRCANPPSGVGILYCLLDLLTVLACQSEWMARLEAPPEEVRELALEVA